LNTRVPERTPSGAALYLALMAFGIDPSDPYIERYDLSRLDSEYAVSLLQRARRDVKQLRDVLVADDENMHAVRQEGRTETKKRSDE
jgi:hypothetical protein